MDFKERIIMKENSLVHVNCHVPCNKKMKNIIDFSLTPFYLVLKETIDWYVKAIKR